MSPGSVAKDLAASGVVAFTGVSAPAVFDIAAVHVIAVVRITVIRVIRVVVRLLTAAGPVLGPCGDARVAA